MNEFRKNKWVARVVMMLALLTQLHLFATPFAHAQVTKGNLQGVVTDPNGAVIAGATVKVTNADTGLSVQTTTNEEGFYRLTNLEPGSNYRIEVTATGFGTKTLERVPVRLGTENSGDVQLPVSGGGETVDVSAGAQLIETTQSQTSTNFTSQQITQLPFAGSIDTLALLTPGVATPGDSDFTNPGSFSANGNRARSNNFQIDGQDNNDNGIAGPNLGFTNREAIAEYQVITNNFSAEFGRNAGAQVNAITKSGSNEFHGSLFNFHDNSALNARDNLEKKSEATYRFLASQGFSEFASFAERVPNPFARNRFGGAVGGPIKKEKAFFFATYERDVNRGESLVDNLGLGTVTFTPESAQLAAQLFPNAATAALVSTERPGGPTTSQGSGTILIVPPTADANGDGVPDTLLFDESTNFFAPLAYVRNGNSIVPLLGGEVIATRRNDFTNSQFITRMDYNFTSKDSLQGRLIYNTLDAPLGTGGGSTAAARLDYEDSSINVGITYTRTISSRLVNEARFTYQRLQIDFGDTSAKTLPSITFGTSSTNASGLLNLAFGTPNGFPQSRDLKVYQWQDNVTTTIGNHGLKFGADIRYQDGDNFFLPNFLGAATFSGSTSTAVAGTLPANTFFNANGTARTGAARGIENFLLGRPRTIGFALGSPQILIQQKDFFFYIQDDWRVRPTLTLNLGLRYEISTSPFNPLIEQLNLRESDPVTSIFLPTWALETRTFSKLPVDKNNFQPRIGFAWSPNFGFLGERFTNGRTVIRGGFGISHDAGFWNLPLNTVGGSPFVATGNITQTPGAAGSVSFPFLPSTKAEASLTPGTNGGDPRLFSRLLFDPNLYSPYTMSYHFGIQQELFRGGVLEVRYVGNRVVGQFQSINTNPRLDYLNVAGTYLANNAGLFTNGNIGVARAGTFGNFRLDPAFGVTQMRTNGGSSTYNGLQLRFDARIRNALTMNANYSFSRTIDNVSEIFNSLAGGQTRALSQDPFNTTSGERGLSAFHQKHTFSAGVVYDLPFFQEQRGFVGKLLGGYQVNTVVFAGSGRPYSVLQLFGSYDPNITATTRPYAGNPNAPKGTIAYGSFAATNILGDDRAEPGQFILYNTLQPGSQGTVVSAAEALDQARYIYNDFGALAQLFGLTPAQFLSFLPDLEAFNIFKTPFGMGRNTAIGEPSYTVNLGIVKSTNIDEARKLEFRVEAFNLFNHRNFGVPDVIAEDAFLPGVGVSTFLNPGFITGGSRTMRIGVRFLF